MHSANGKKTHSIKLLINILLICFISNAFAIEPKPVHILDTINIEANSPVVAKIIEFSSTRHVVAAIYDDSSLKIGDYLNIKFEANKSCSFKIIGMKEERQIIFAATNKCLYESKIAVGMSLSRSLIDADIELAIGSDNQIISSFLDNSLNSLIFKPQKGHFYGLTSVGAFSYSGFFDWKLGGIENDLFYGVTDNTTIGLAIGYIFGKTYGQGVTEPVISFSQNVWKRNDWILDFSGVYSPKVGSKNLDISGDWNGVRGGSYLALELGIGKYQSSKEHRLSFNYSRNFESEITMLDQQYGRKDGWALLELKVSNQVSINDIVSLGLDLSLRYNGEEYQITSYVQTVSRSFKGYSIMGYFKWILISDLQIFLSSSITHSFGDITVWFVETDDYIMSPYKVFTTSLGFRYNY